jgi:hypothetical protein
MKDYKQFIRQLPNTTIVCALGEFNPPTTAHELLVQTVKVVAEQRGADHIIFTSPSEILQEDKKQQFLSLMFPKSKFVSLGEAFFASVVKKLNEKYKNVIIIAGADQFDEFKTLKESADVEIISIGTKDPDADFPKMKQYATKGIYEDFKKLLPSTIRDMDGKRLMNEMRIGMELEPIKEQLNLVKDKLREKYFRGEIFNVGQLVESSGQQYEIVKRGSNHLLLKDQSGELVSKWITDVKEITEAVIQPNGTDKIDTNSPEAAGNNQVQKPKGKVKGFLTFYNYDDKTKTVNEEIDEGYNDYHNNRSGFARRGREDDEYHVPDPVTRTHKVGFHVSKDGAEKHHRTVTISNSTKTPEEAKSMARAHLEKQGYKIHEETVEQKKDREKQLKRFRDQTASTPTQDRPGISTENIPNSDPFFKEDLSDELIDQLIEELDEEELLGLDEHDEWDLVYEDTGEVVEPHEDEAKIDLMEVLSRQERIKGKIRLRRTSAKRSRSTKINVHRFAPPKTINARARRLAIKLIKKRMLRGRSPSQASVGDKERIEKQLHKNKALVDRVAQKLVVRVRKVEKSRMSKGKIQKGQMTPVF